MPSLPEQLQRLISSSTLSTDLQGQIGSITTAAATLGNLVDSPPGEIDDLINGLTHIPLTHLQLPDDFLRGFSSLAQVVPGDLTDITGNLDTLMAGMGEVLDVSVLESIQAFMLCLGRLSPLIEMDFKKFQWGSTPPGSPSLAQGIPGTTGELEGSEAHDSGGSEGGAGEPAGHDPAEHNPVSVEADNSPAIEPLESRAVVATKNISEILGAFPTPFNGENALLFFRDVLRGLPRDNAKMAHIPVYDDVLQLFDTALEFSQMDSVGLVTHIQNTLTSLATALDREGLKPVHDLTRRGSELLVRIDFDQLGLDSIQVAEALEEIAAALDSEDISGIDTQLLMLHTALDTLSPQLESIQASVLDNELAQMDRSLVKFSRNMDQSLQRLQRILKAPAAADGFVIIEDLIQQGLHQSGIQDLTVAAENLFKHMGDILGLLNTARVQQALTSVTTGLDAALEGFDTVLLQVTRRVSQVFDEIDHALDSINTAGFQETVENALQEIETRIASVMEQFFTPLRDVITSGVDLIASAVDSFDPERIKATIQNVIDQITGIFSSPQVLEGIQLIKSTIETVTEQLQAVSFAPIAEGVVTGIEEVKKVFQLVEPALLSESLTRQLQTAITALPGDLEQPIHRLTSELDRLIQEGPKPLILKIQVPVASLAAQLHEISPDRLVGNELFNAYETLLTDLAGFTPSTLLIPVQNALTELKAEIVRQMDLNALFQPLEEAHQGLVGQLNQLDPRTIIQPINQQIGQMTTGFLDLVPEESLFEIVEHLISGLESARAFVDEVKHLLSTLTGMATGLADPETQLTLWLQPVLDQVDTLPEIPGIEITFQTISQNIDQLKKAGLMAQIDQALLPLQTALGSLDLETLQNRLFAVNARLNRSAIEALAPSTQKTDLLALVDHLSLVSPRLGRVLSKLEETHTRLQTLLDNREGMLAHWDDRFFGTEACLSALQLGQAGPQTVKEMIRESIQAHTIQPISKLFSSLATAFSAFDGPVNELQQFVDGLDGLFSDILEGPGSLGEIQKTLQGLVDRIRNLNLDFLEQALDRVFNSVKQKFDDINPRPLRDSLQALLDNTLDLIDVQQLLPYSQVEQIDRSYGEAISALTALNPNTLISEIVQPAFDEKIEPILKLFDLTDPISLLLERMDGLAQELKSELDKVDTAYKAMMQAVPL